MFVSIKMTTIIMILMITIYLTIMITTTTIMIFSLVGKGDRPPPLPPPIPNIKSFGVTLFTNNSMKVR